jgi:hypothetical protein
MLSNGLTTAPIAGEPCRKSPIFKAPVLIQVKSNRMTGDILALRVVSAGSVTAERFCGISRAKVVLSP